MSKIRFGGIPLDQARIDAQTQSVTKPVIKGEINAEPEPEIKAAPEPATRPEIKVSIPRLDAHAEAALAALKGRKNLKQAAAVAAASAANASDDDDDDDDDDDADADKTKKKPSAAPHSMTKTSTSGLKKRPAGADIIGCGKCRGRGCTACRDPNFGGTHITVAEYNEKQRQKKKQKKTQKKTDKTKKKK
jgi:hypothetical protein